MNELALGSRLSRARVRVCETRVLSYLGCSRHDFWVCFQGNLERLIDLKSAVPTAHVQAFSSSRQYNEMAVLRSLEHMANAVNKPLPAFEDEIKSYFRQNRYTLFVSPQHACARVKQSRPGPDRSTRLKRLREHLVFF